MDTGAIVAAAVPVLLIDTCSIVDIMRDPTRDTHRPIDQQAAMDLLAAAESGRLIGLIADQVAVEFAEHDQSVQEEARRKMRSFQDQIIRINNVAAIYGATANLDLAHLDDRVNRTRTAVGRWLTQLDTPDTRSIGTWQGIRADERR